MKDIIVSEIVEVLGGGCWWKVSVGHENDGQCLAIRGKFCLCRTVWVWELQWKYGLAEKTK